MIFHAQHEINNPETEFLKLHLPQYLYVEFKGTSLQTQHYLIDHISITPAYRTIAGFLGYLVPKLLILRKNLHLNVVGYVDPHQNLPNLDFYYKKIEV